jgi:hypothetical protein
MAAHLSRRSAKTVLCMRFRVRVGLAGGLKLYTFYANSGKTFDVTPTGSAGQTRVGIE